MRSEGGNAFTERPAQGTGEIPHGSFCLPESHCEESQEQGFKVPSVVVDSTELVNQVHEHAHVDCSPTQLARSVVLGAAQGIWSRCYRPVYFRETFRIGDLSGVVSDREGVL